MHTATEKNEFRVSSEWPLPAATESRVSPEWPKPQRAESRLSEEKTRDSLVTRRTHSDPTERVPTTGGDAAEALDALPLLVVSCVCLDLVFTCTLAKFIYRYSPLFSFFLCL